MAEAAGAESVIRPVDQYVRTMPQARSSKDSRFTPVLANLYQRPTVAWAEPIPSGIMMMTFRTPTARAWASVRAFNFKTDDWPAAEEAAAGSSRKSTAGAEAARIRIMPLRTGFSFSD